MYKHILTSFVVTTPHILYLGYKLNILDPLAFGSQENFTFFCTNYSTIKVRTSLSKKVVASTKKSDCFVAPHFCEFIAQSPNRQQSVRSQFTVSSSN